MARPSLPPTSSGPQDPSRRRGLLGALGGLGSIGAATLIGCGGGGSSGDESSSSGTLALDSSTEEGLAKIMAVGAATCTVAATETEGPYPLRAILANTATETSRADDDLQTMLVSYGIPEETAAGYHAVLTNGGVLVWVRTGDSRVGEVAEVFRSHNGKAVTANQTG